MNLENFTTLVATMQKQAKIEDKFHDIGFSEAFFDDYYKVFYILMDETFTKDYAELINDFIYSGIVTIHQYGKVFSLNTAEEVYDYIMKEKN